MAGALALGATLLAGCTLEYSERSDFQRDVPAPDPDACRNDALTWRATSILVDAPSGLAAFQSLLTSATDSGNLNFVITQAEEELLLDQSPWALSIGTADALGGGCYAPSPDYPLSPAIATVDVSGAERPLSATDLAFVVVAKLPFATPLPLTDTEVSAIADSEQEHLIEGRVEGVILGEVAATILLDLTDDGNPDNDLPLTNFLGDPDIDVDGDGVIDDFSASIGFESERVGLLQ